MSSEWPLKNITEITESLNHKRVPLSGMDRQNTQGQYPYYGASGIVDYIDDYIFDGTYLLISEDGENLRSRNTPIAFKANGKFWVNNHAHILDEKEEGILDFLEYYFSQLNLSPYITGAVQPKLNKGNLQKIELRVPPLEQRLEINDILNGFTEKIHLNQQTNETLEAMAQAIFKSWFVDFDPVRAKIKVKSAGRDPNRAAMAVIAGVSSFAGLFRQGYKDQEASEDRQDWDAIDAALQQKLDRMTDDKRTQLRQTAELFPDELVESEIGVVPKGWGIKPFYDTIEIIGGGTPKTKIDEYWGGEINWYSVVDAPNESDVFVIDTEKKITKTGLENSSAKLVDVGTTIISARGTVGKLALTPKPMTYNQSCYGLRSQIDCPYFNFYKTKQLVESLKRGSHGSVFDTITQKTFKTIDIVQPSENLEKRFDEAVDGIMIRIKKNSEENITLSQLRDTLLPKLILGEVGVFNVN